MVHIWQSDVYYKEWICENHTKCAWYVNQLIYNHSFGFFLSMCQNWGIFGYERIPWHGRGQHKYVLKVLCNNFIQYMFCFFSFNVIHVSNFCAFSSVSHSFTSGGFFFYSNTKHWDVHVSYMPFIWFLIE